MADPNLPSWCICIATLNRRAALMRTLDFAVRQTCPPQQIVVVDVSEDWEESRVEALSVVSGFPDIELVYVTSQIRSSATQRNEGVALCHHPIVFFLDDDSFMHPDCAEAVLNLFAKDTAKAVAGVAISLVAEIPVANTDGRQAPQVAVYKKDAKARRLKDFYGLALNTSFGRWFNRKVLMQSQEEGFIKYEGPRATTIPEPLVGEDVAPVSFMPGCGMVARLEVTQAEGFDTALRYYAAAEDLDVSYRFGRHGALLRSYQARLHHFEAAGGRLKRKKLIIFQLLNLLIFLKRNAAVIDDHRAAYRTLVWRKLLAESLKDLLSGRLGFPQAFGVLKVMRMWRNLWDMDAQTIDDWYPQLQQSILDELR